ncbi:MAG: hypothetical protein PHY64_10665, partial [Eubacteriales bacterium]|nr:hypothetical protein [Eubacteriales bacterium]
MTRSQWKVGAYCLLVAAVCLAICSKSSFLYPINDWTDANAYFSCGKGMLNGRVMYRDLYEHKGPLLYALHMVCALISYTDFTGEFIMEILSVGMFLLAAYRIMKLYTANNPALFWLPVLAAVVLSSLSFQQGDSAEELCMPMLAWSLYGVLQWARQNAPVRMSTGKLLLHGFLCGCVLWIKFTMLGFYAAWILGLMIYHFTRRNGKAAFTAMGWFAAGVALATLPWLVYFGLNGAIGPWLKTYLYDNIFLYQDGESLGAAARIKAMLHSALDWFAANWAYAVPMALSLVWFTFQKKPDSSRSDGGKCYITAVEKGFVWALAALLALGVFIGGKSYLYYGLILAAFSPLAVLPLVRWTERWIDGRRTLAAALAAAVTLGAGGLCLAASPNAPDLLKPREDTMQYRFAAIINQTPDATLLNYGFMDAGFYTACGIAPTVKYFHQTNVHLQEMLDEQVRYIDEGVTDYVVTRGRQPDTILNRYELIATEK